MTAVELNENNVVVRIIIVEDLSWAQDNLPGTWIADTDPPSAIRGYIYENGSFVPPTPQ